MSSVTVSMNLLLGSKEPRPNQITCTSWRRSGHISFSFLVARCVWWPPQGETGTRRRVATVWQPPQNEVSCLSLAPQGGSPSQPLRSSTDRPALRSSSDPVRPGRIQPPGTSARNVTHPPHPSACCCTRLGTAAWGPGTRGTLPPRPPQTSAVASCSAPRRHPES